VPTADALPRGYTVREVARLYRVSPDRVRTWIRSGRLRAINTATARCGKPRFIVLPHHLDEFERELRVSPPPKPSPRRRSQRGLVDYYPDCTADRAPAQKDGGA
jgi:excisionase family DNA binding protein